MVTSGVKKNTINLIPPYGSLQPGDPIIIATCTPTANGYDCAGKLNFDLNNCATNSIILPGSTTPVSVETCTLGASTQNYLITPSNGNVNTYGVLIVLIVVIVIFMLLAKK